MTACIHGIGDPAWCTVCKHGPGRTARPQLRYKLQAAFDGHCTACELPIMVGQLIARWTDDRYRHEGCTP